MEIFGISGSSKPSKAPIFDMSPLNGASTTKVTLKKSLQQSIPLSNENEKLIKTPNNKNIFKNESMGQNNYMIGNDYEND